MIIINTTFVTEKNLCNDLLQWIRDTYVSSAIYCNALRNKVLITKILNRIKDGSESFAVHLWFETIEEASDWDNKLGSRLRAKLQDHWGQKAMAFHTYMEVTA